MQRVLQKKFLPLLQKCSAANCSQDGLNVACTYELLHTVEEFFLEHA
jgi:hypothetical protein